MDLHSAELLTRQLMEEFGLLEKGWKFAFNNSKTYNGFCRFRYRLIVLSRIRTPLREEKWVENTIRHEIAHALVMPTSGHGPIWQAMAIKVGASPERCSADGLRIDLRFVSFCPVCSAKFTRSRRTRVPLHCRKCFRLGHRHSLIWTDSLGDFPPHERI